MTQRGRFNHSWSIFMRPETQLCCMTYLQADSGAHKPPCEVHLFRDTGSQGKRERTCPQPSNSNNSDALLLSSWSRPHFPPNKKVGLAFLHCKLQISFHQPPPGNHPQNRKIRQVPHPLKHWLCSRITEGCLVK